jgi:hypothetical protein
MGPARAFFMKSVEEAYERLQHDRPIQADLYIVVHFLVHQDLLQFESDPKKAAQWREKIVAYFLSTSGKDVWEAEGCLTIKLLMGFRMSKVPISKWLPIARSYRSFIREHWGKDGVGECYSPKVIRTYGSNPPGNASVGCGPVTDELVTKTAYYQALAAEDREDPMLDVPLPTLDRPPASPLREWSDVIPEKWLVRAYRLGKSSHVSEKRFEAARKEFAEAIATAPLKKSPVPTSFLTPLLYASWLAGNGIDARSFALFRAVLSSQWDDGRIPNPMTAARAKGHNIDASTTYQALMAMTMFLEKQKTCME